MYSSKLSSSEKIWPIHLHEKRPIKVYRWPWPSDIEAAVGVKLYSLYLLISSHLFFGLFHSVLFIGPCGTVLQDTKECVQNKEEQNRLVIKNLKEENEKLSTYCADLLNDLEKLRKQEAHWRKEKYSIDAKIKVCNENGICAVILDLTSYRKFITCYFL